MLSGKTFLNILIFSALAVVVFCAGCTGTTPQTTGTPQVTVAPTSSAATCSCPELIFRDEEFAFELRRTLSAVYSGEADVGECLATSSRIKEGDFESWYQEWYATAEYFRKAGDESLAEGHNVSAREAYYRAATYYRTAEFFLHGNPSDPRILATWGKSRDTFRAAIALDTIPFEIISIPYQNTTLPGYFYKADTSGKPRPLLIVQTGFDGTQEELHPYAVEGIRRGYNALTFEGPGQGEMIRVQKIPFRADWENVVTPVIDYAMSRPDVDKDRIALWGISLGGYLAPRAAAHEYRINALIVDAGIYDMGMIFVRNVKLMGGPFENITREQLHAYLLSDPAEFNGAMKAQMKTGTGNRWFFEHGMYVFNASSPALFWAKEMECSLDGLAEKIQCPTLITTSETDHFDPGAVQAKMLYDHITGKKELMIFSDEYEAGYHCQMGAFAQSFGKKFDWLDEVMGKGR